MLLRSARIDNFRAIRCATIHFDPTTVLIGENDCGRSSAMEAIALALGWNSPEGAFGFQPYHAHRGGLGSGSDAAPISIALEFYEGVTNEWRGEEFLALRSALPGVLGRPHVFSFEVTHERGGATHWVFRSGRERLIDEPALLAWLRRRAPVLWMGEGIVSGGRVEAPAPQASDSMGLAVEVSRHYRELLDGTAPDVTFAIEHGSAAARELLARAKMRRPETSPFGELR